jgi:hypothetical protein
MTVDTFSPIAILTINLFDLNSYGNNKGLSPLNTGPHTYNLPS